MTKTLGWSATTLAAMVLAGCPGPTPPAGSDAGVPETDAAPIRTPDASRDAGPDAAFVGDPFDAYVEALTAARRAECTCYWEDEGYASLDACVEDALERNDVVACSREGYEAARGASRDSYTCMIAPLSIYTECQASAACDSSRSSACVETVNAALGRCPELPEAWQTAHDACYLRTFIGPDSGCPEAGDPWMGTGTFTGDTTLAGNDSNPDESCYGGELPDWLEISADRSYRWIAPEPGTYVFDTTGSELDTVLYLKRTCDGPIIACSDDIDLENENYASRVTFTAEAANDEVIVVVDSYAAQSSGTFQVTVTRSTPTP